MNALRTFCLFASLAVCAACGGCAADRSDQPRAGTTATPAQQAALIEQVKKLEGTWTGSDEQGTTWKHVFKVSSSGSAVREIMFPGEAHEMTNMYHMDGPTLIMTHYCAAGNQPRMRAHAGTRGQISFKADGVGNLASPDAEYMGEMTIVFEDNNHIRQEWRSVKGGVAAPASNPVFRLTRSR